MGILQSCEVVQGDAKRHCVHEHHHSVTQTFATDCGTRSRTVYGIHSVVLFQGMREVMQLRPPPAPRDHDHWSLQIVLDKTNVWTNAGPYNNQPHRWLWCSTTTTTMNHQVVTSWGRAQKDHDWGHACKKIMSDRLVHNRWLSHCNGGGGGVRRLLTVSIYYGKRHTNEFASVSAPKAPKACNDGWHSKSMWPSSVCSDGVQPANQPINSNNTADDVSDNDALAATVNLHPPHVPIWVTEKNTIGGVGVYILCKFLAIILNCQANRIEFVSYAIGNPCVSSCVCGELSSDWLIKLVMCALSPSQVLISSRRREEDRQCTEHGGKGFRTT